MHQDNEEEARKFNRLYRKLRKLNGHCTIPISIVEIKDSEDPPFQATLVSPSHSPIRVYLGSVSDAMYPRALKERGIAGIINAAHRQCRDIQRVQREGSWGSVDFSPAWYQRMLVLAPQDAPFRYLALDAEDHPRYKISDHFEECIAWLNEIEKSNSSQSSPAVLIHCIQGHNRSAALCVAWLMRRFELDLESALFSIAQNRKGILSNKSFLMQLLKFASVSSLCGEENDIRPIQKIVTIGNIQERF